MRRWNAIIAVMNLWAAMLLATAWPAWADAVDPPADAITLTTGEVLRGKVVEYTPEQCVLDHPILGRLLIAGDAIAMVELGGSRTGADTSPLLPPAPPAPPPAAPGATGSDAAAAIPRIPMVEPPAQPPLDEPRWRSQLEFGASATAGNTEESDIRLRFVSTRTAPENTLKLDSLYRMTTSEGTTRSNNFTAGALSNWPVPASRWSYFAEGRFDYDEFVSWDYRVSGAAGVAYRLIDFKRARPHGAAIEELLLSLRAGAGARREFGSEINSVQPEGLFGTDLKWQINSHQRFEVEATVYPSLSALGEFRLVTKGAWVLDVDQLRGLSLKVGLTDNYESQTDSGVKHNDLAVFSSLVLNF